VPRSQALDRLLAGTERSIALDCLLGGGDDYELCFTAPREAAARVGEIAAAAGVALTRIGAITAAPGLVVRDERGARLPAPPKAFDHFA
jgi:thiamine-monophosphate kinase